MKVKEPKNVNEAIRDLEMFLLCDLPSLVFPMDRVTGKTMFREDFFESKRQIEKYIHTHFKILKKQIRDMKGKKGNED